MRLDENDSKLMLCISQTLKHMVMQERGDLV